VLDSFEIGVMKFAVGLRKRKSACHCEKKFVAGIIGGSLSSLGRKGKEWGRGPWIINL